MKLDLGLLMQFIGNVGAPDVTWTYNSGPKFCIQNDQSDGAGPVIAGVNCVTLFWEGVKQRTRHRGSDVGRRPSPTQTLC